MPHSLLKKILAWRYRNKDDKNERLVRAYKNLSSTVDGQIVLDDLLAFTGVHRDPYQPGDPHETSRQTGIQRVGRRILSFIGTNEAVYVTLEKENRDEREIETRSNAKINEPEKGPDAPGGSRRAEY